MATLAEQLAEKQAELVVVKAAIARIMTGGQSSTIEGMSISRGSLSTLREERTQLEKSITRLLRGGRGIVIDMSCAVTGNEADEVVYTVAP
jgi:hypothetical protein